MTKQTLLVLPLHIIHDKYITYHTVVCRECYVLQNQIEAIWKDGYLTGDIFFAISERGTFIITLTKTGKKTLNSMSLNCISLNTKQ